MVFHVVTPNMNGVLSPASLFLYGEKYGGMEDAMLGMFVLSALVGLALFVYVIVFLAQLERLGCACARDWRRIYILTYASTMALYSVIELVILITAKDINVAIARLAPLQYVIAPLYWIGGILFVVFTLQYVHRLKKEKCECSDKVGRAVLSLVALIDAAVFALTGLLILSGAALFILSPSK